MPLHFGKIFAAIALLTVGAFIAWLLFTTLFATEQAEQKIEKHGRGELAITLPARPEPSVTRRAGRSDKAHRS